MMKALSVSNLYKKIEKRILSMSPLEIFVIIAVLALTVFTVKFFGIRSEWRTIQVEVIGRDWTQQYSPDAYKTPYWLSDKLKVGQTEKNNTGQVIARLINFDSYEKNGQENDNYLTVQVKVDYNKRTNRYSFKDKYLSVGLPIDLNLDNVSITGQVIDDNVPEEGYPTKIFTVKMIAYGLRPWVYSEFLNKPKTYNQGNHELIADIIDAQTKDQTYKSMWLDNGLLRLNQDTAKDLYLTVKLKATQIDGKWYYAVHQPIKIGSFIFLLTDKVNAGFEIEEINESAN